MSSPSANTTTPREPSVRSTSGTPSRSAAARSNRPPPTIAASCSESLSAVTCSSAAGSKAASSRSSPSPETRTRPWPSSDSRRPCASAPSVVARELVPQEWCNVHPFDAGLERRRVPGRPALADRRHAHRPLVARVVELEPARPGRGEQGRAREPVGEQRTVHLRVARHDLPGLAQPPERLRSEGGAPARSRGAPVDDVTRHVADDGDPGHAPAYFAICLQVSPRSGVFLLQRAGSTPEPTDERSRIQ